MPLKRLSPGCLLIARGAQGVKHSHRYVLVERGLAYCQERDRAAGVIAPIAFTSRAVGDRRLQRRRSARLRRPASSRSRAASGLSPLHSRPRVGSKTKPIGGRRRRWPAASIASSSVSAGLSRLAQTRSEAGPAIGECEDSAGRTARSCFRLRTRVVAFVHVECGHVEGRRVDQDGSAGWWCDHELSSFRGCRDPAWEGSPCEPAGSGAGDQPDSA